VKLSIDPLVCFLAAFLILAVPLPYLVQWCTAMLIHEAGHIIAVILLGGTLRSVRIRVGGIVMKTGEMGYSRSLLCILAGPICGAIPLVFIRRFPVLGMFSGILTVYNLLPFWPLDGGRILCLIAHRLKGFGQIFVWYKGLMAFVIFAAAIKYRLVILLIPVCIYLREIFLANKEKKGYNSATIIKR